MNTINTLGEKELVFFSVFYPVCFSVVKHNFVIHMKIILLQKRLTRNGIARSQTTPGHCTSLFFFWSGGRGEGWGHAFLVNFGMLELLIVLETIFEMPLVLNREWF